jgi:hypothetical protein
MVCPIHAYSDAQERGKYCSNPFATRLEKKADGQQDAPAACPPPSEKNMVPTAQESGCVSGPIWRAQKVTPAPGFDIPALQLIASRYT